MAKKWLAFIMSPKSDALKCSCRLAVVLKRNVGGILKWQNCTFSRIFFALFCHRCSTVVSIPHCVYHLWHTVCVFLHDMAEWGFVRKAVDLCSRVSLTNLWILIQFHLICTFFALNFSPPIPVLVAPYHRCCVIAKWFIALWTPCASFHSSFYISNIISIIWAISSAPPTNW